MCETGVALTHENDEYQKALALLAKDHQSKVDALMARRRTYELTESMNGSVGKALNQIGATSIQAEYVQAKRGRRAYVKGTT